MTAFLGGMLVLAMTLPGGTASAGPASILLNGSFEHRVNPLMSVCGDAATGNWTPVRMGDASSPTVIDSPVHRGKWAAQSNNHMDLGFQDLRNGFAQHIGSFAPTQQIVFSAWVYPFAGWEDLILQGGTDWCGSTGIVLHMVMLPNVTYLFALGDSTVVQGPAISPGEWHHVSAQLNLVVRKATLTIDGRSWRTPPGEAMTIDPDEVVFLGQAGLTGQSQDAFCFDNVQLAAS